MDNFKNLKKYIPKRKYRERDQLQERKKKGFLEKKQDYKIRSKDFQAKRDRYNKYIELARTKNPDEFYYGMMKNPEDVGLDKSKDKVNKYINLVNHKISILQKKLKKEHELIIPSVMENSHIHKIYVDSIEDVNKFDAKEYFNSELIENQMNRVKKSQMETIQYKTFEEEEKKSNKVNKLINIKDNLDKLCVIKEGITKKRIEKMTGRKRKEEDGSYRFFQQRKK